MHAEALAHVTQANAFLAWCGVGRNGIHDAEYQPFFIHAEVDRYMDRPFVAGETMCHGILDQWLQDQARHPEQGKRIGRWQFDGDSIFEAAFLQPQIEPYELQLVA